MVKLIILIFKNYSLLSAFNLIIKQLYIYFITYHSPQSETNCVNKYILPQPIIYTRTILEIICK